ncbi:hypothetical protein KKI24_17305 [bacterium]|nr:hypothetical protein [bacterium]
MDTINLEHQIDQAYSGRSLTDIHHRYFKGFLETRSDFYHRHGLNQQAFYHLSVPKKLLVRLMAAIFADLSILRGWIETLPDPVLHALNILAWEGPVDADTLESRIGCPVLTTGKTVDQGLQRVPRVDFCLLQCIFFKSFWGAEGSSYSLDLPPLLRQLLKPLLPEPAGLTLVGFPTESSAEFQFKDGGHVLNVLPKIYRFLEQGQLELTQQGTPRTQSINRMQKTCGLKEFYDERQATESVCLRTRMMADLLRLPAVERKPGDALQVLKNIFRQYLALRSYPHLSFLSHIKGLHHCRDAINHRLHYTNWDLLGCLPENQWLHVQQIIRFARLRGLDLSPVSKQSADRYLSITMEWQGWGNKKKVITPDRYEQALEIPLLKASLFLYASFGLLDLMYNAPENSTLRSAGKPYLSVYDGLVSVRLTELGAYIAGQRATYDFAQPSAPEMAFELDTERLFISYSIPDSLTALSLERFAHRIGPVRYKVDFVSFLKGCRNRDDVMTRIQVFKDEISDCLPPIWQAFFKTVVQRVGVLLPVDDMRVYAVPPGSDDLIDTIIRDKALRSLIFMAEGQHILIRAQDLEQFKKRLEELGFLM